MLTIKSIKAEPNVKTAKRIANNTAQITYTNGDVAYRLHATDVVTYHPDGSITVDFNGWDTLTTRERINRYLPDRFSVWRKNGDTFFVKLLKPKGSNLWKTGDWEILFKIDADKPFTFNPAT